MVVDGEGLQSKVTLNDGYKMPLFGLGVFKALSDDGKGAIKFALQNGYRIIDTSASTGKHVALLCGPLDHVIKREN